MTFAERFLLAVAVVAAAPHAARADAVGAEALFREGKRLMKDHQIAAACDKFEASNRLDASVGTQLNLADCREKNGQLATAWATFLEAASAARAAGDAARETEARSRAGTLEPRLAYLTISVPAASHVDGLVIKRGDVAIDPALWNQGVPIDTGAYEITGQAPGHEPWSTRVQIDRDGQKLGVEVPRFKQLADLGPAVVAKPAPADPGPASDDGEPEPPRVEESRFTTLRKAALVTAGVGVAAIAGGIGFGLTARDLQHQSDALCPATACADPHGLDLNRRARRDALASEILFGAGGVAVAGAVVLWIVGAPARVTPTMTDRQVGLAFNGTF